MWLGRLAAWLVFIPSTVAAVVAMDAGEWKALALFATAAAVALWLALAVDRRIVGEQRQRKAEQIRAWSGAEITVHLRWLDWFLINTLVGMLGLLFTAMIRYGNLLAQLMGLVVVPAAALAVLGSLRVAVLVLRAGYLVRLDPLGVHHFRTGTIPWRSVQGVALGTIPTKYRPVYLLDFVLQPQAARELPRARLLRWLPPPKKVQISLGMIDIDPHLLLQAARVIAGRAGVPVALPEYPEPTLSDDLLDLRHG